MRHMPSGCATGCCRGCGEEGLCAENGRYPLVVLSDLVGLTNLVRGASKELVVTHHAPR